MPVYLLSRQNALPCAETRQKLFIYILYFTQSRLGVSHIANISYFIIIIWAKCAIILHNHYAIFVNVINHIFTITLSKLWIILHMIFKAIISMNLSKQSPKFNKHENKQLLSWMTKIITWETIWSTRKRYILLLHPVQLLLHLLKYRNSAKWQCTNCTTTWIQEFCKTVKINRYRN